MLIRDEVEKAVRLQPCGYQLLKWLEKAMKDWVHYSRVGGNRDHF